MDEYYTAKKKNKIDPHKFAMDIWEVPLDVKFKNATYSISIKEYKKMIKQYEYEKKEKERKRKEKE
jgi:hypothetical protein